MRYAVCGMRYAVCGMRYAAACFDIHLHVSWSKSGIYSIKYHLLFDDATPDVV
jgi:hypothetical protein